MVEYGVLVNNKFDFAGDQSEDEAEDPSVLLQKADVTKVEKTAAQKKAEKKAEKLKKEKAAAAAKEAEAKKAAAAAKTAVAGKENARPEGGRGGPRGGRGGPRGPPGAPRPPRENGEGGERPPFTGERRGRGTGAPRPPRGGGFRGGARGGSVSGGEEHPHEDGQPKDVESQPAGDRPPFAGGRGRGGGRGRPPRFDGEQRSPREEGTGEDRPPRPPRGAFRGGRGRFGDRQSGSDRTGVKPVDAKSGHGKGNWGTDQDEITAAEGVENVEKPEEEAVPAAPREKTAEEIAAEEEEARLAAQKTLAEFRAEQKRKDDAKFNIRKAGEGDEANFGKLVPIPKKNIEDEKTGDDEEVIIVKKEPRNKQIIVDFKFNDPNRGGDFGGRGRGGDRGRRGAPPPGGRTRGGRGGGGGQGRYNEPFHVAEEAFPALGAA